MFPTEHVRRTLIAARDGQTILEFPVYDGSETGEKVYNTLTVIGRAIGPDERVPTDVAGRQQGGRGTQALAGDRQLFRPQPAKPASRLPVYAIAFELYENGVSRALVLDYNEFSIAGEMTALELKEASPVLNGTPRMTAE